MTWNRKILIVLIPLSIVFLLLTAFLSYTTLDNLMMDRSMNDNDNVMKQIESQVMNAFDETELFARIICMDETINEKLMSGDNLSVYEQDRIRYDIMAHFKSYTSLCRLVDTFIIERPDGEIFTSERGYEQDYAEEFSQPWYQNYKKQGLNGTFSEKHRFFTPMGSKYVDGVSYILRYTIPEDPRGGYYYLTAEINWDVFETLLAQYTSDYANIYLLDRAGQSLNGPLPDEEIPLQSDTAEYQETASSYYKITGLGRTGWRLLLVLNKSQMSSRSIAQTFGFLLIVVPLFVGLILALTSLVMRTGHSLKKLTSAMRDISEGRLDTRVTLHTGDEFEVLGNSVNEMAEHLKEYMNARMQAEEDRQKIRTNLLLAQIRPHFIYNTLNSIVYLTEDERLTDAISCTNSLISLLQDTVQFIEHEEMTTLEKELETQKHYLNIQGTRYPDAFVLVFCVPEELKGCIVPKMLLQPVVENALIHGIVPSGKCCELRIGAEDPGDGWLVLYVSDNGVGMTEEQIRECLNRQGNYGMRGIALSNILERLRLMYGGNYNGLSIHSVPGEGTRIEIRVRMIRRGEEHGTDTDTAAG